MELAEYIETFDGEDQIIVFTYGNKHIKNIKEHILKKQEDDSKGFGLIGLSREMMYKKRKTKSNKKMNK
jgi:hypothetical protein